MWRSSPALLLALVAGCASGLPVQQDVVVSGSRFVAVQGEADLVVRAFLLDETAARREVAGAECTVQTSLYDARLITPARLVVPNFGPQSPTLGIVCTALGREGAAQQRIVTTWRAAPGALGRVGPGWYGGGWAGTGLYGGGWGWDGPSVPVSSYPDVGVVLR